MSVRLLKEVLDDFNVTYEVSEKKCDLIVKVCQARGRHGPSPGRRRRPGSGRGRRSGPDGRARRRATSGP